MEAAGGADPDLVTRAGHGRHGMAAHGMAAQPSRWRTMSPSTM